MFAQFVEVGSTLLGFQTMLILIIGYRTTARIAKAGAEWLPYEANNTISAISLAIGGGIEAYTCRQP